MKSKKILLLAVMALSLTSCDFLFKTVKTEESEINIYDIDKIAYGNDKDINNAKSGIINARFISGESYIPYITLNQYANLYASHLDKNAVSEVTVDGSTYYWNISVNNEAYFYAAISPYLKVMIKAGDISNAFASNDDPKDTSALSYGMTSNSEYKALGSSNYATYDFSYCSFKSFRYNGEIYMPLGFYDVAFSESSGIYFTYNYKNIYETRDADNYAETVFSDGWRDYTVDSQMEEITKGINEPEYLINYNASCFLFVMENLYGLKRYKNISSMRAFYNANGIYDKFFSSDPATRGYNYALALNILDDNHTGLISTNKAWGENAENVPHGQGVVARSSLYRRLVDMRKNAYQAYLGREEKEGGDIIYSNDGKTAMFHFEEFEYGEGKDVFNPDKSIKENAYLSDSFFLFIHQFNAIKAKGGVENVVIDVSTNGGGTVGVMMKLLALISKDNHGTITMYDESTMGASIYTARVDINNDGNYEDNEVYGDDFNIYILASDCSFSCANAFPCTAQKMGIKIIGDKSGGGECAVAIHYLPNSQYVYHSSTLHLGYFDGINNTFEGYESGATPDIPLNNNLPMCYIGNDNEVHYDIPSTFYDIETINTAINNANNQQVQ